MVDLAVDTVADMVVVAVVVSAVAKAATEDATTVVNKAILPANAQVVVEITVVAVINKNAARHRFDTATLHIEFFHTFKASSVSLSTEENIALVVFFLFLTTNLQ
jgi:hypothetical protein